MSDIDWNTAPEEALGQFKKGDMVKAKVLDVDVDKERISLGIKQLESDPFEEAMGDVKKGQVVTCTVVKVVDNGLEVTVKDGVPGFIRKAELSRDRSEQRPDRFAEGEKVDAKVIAIDKASRKLSLSIKAYETAEEKEVMATYGSSDSGASLGDILGAALQQKKQDIEKSQKGGTDEDESEQ
jgi:small subunit ribosomal protein S1